ncbi:MAG: PIN domain-containing protein [Myxococcales bacterium]|nr:PIN domain-containing protein [Myxococcales bacterium]
MSGRTFLDTNVLVYLFSSDEPGKQSRALSAVEELVRRGDAVISTQVMQELYAVLTRKLGLEADAAARCVESIAGLPVVESDGTFVLDAIRLAGAAHLSIWDALVVAAA